jgi:hypothetical protein
MRIRRLCADVFLLGLLAIGSDLPAHAAETRSPPLRPVKSTDAAGTAALPVATPTAGAAAPTAGAAAPTAGAAASAAGAATPTAPAGPIADARWCGVDTAKPAPEPAIPCKHPGLPCGPVSADQISRGSGEVGEDLDGDGTADLTVAGRREVPKTEVYAAIYRSTEAGFVLADYQAVPPRAEPTMASVILAAPGSAPLLRDGYDIVESGGRTHSVARLRRFDGQRFRTLLSFCAHRADPTAGRLREGHNRVEIVDIDKDGQKDVVIHGLVAPVAFRFGEGGLSLVQDAALSQLYREHSPEMGRVKTLRAEAAKLIAAGQLRRATEVLSRAQSALPYDVDLILDLAALQVRTAQEDKALALLSRARFQDPDRAAIYCAQARAHRAMREPASERNALRACLDRNPDDELRSEAEGRLRTLADPSVPSSTSAGDPPAPAPQAIDLPID